MTPSPCCRRCRRTLRNPASIAVGMGPTCAAKTGAAANRARGEPQYFPVGPVMDAPDLSSLAAGVYYIAYPAGGDPRPLSSIRAIHVARWANGIKGARYLDPRLDLDRRSTTGFQYGYGGSGPSQLALAILADHLKDQGQIGEFLARAEYQRFKWEFLSRTQPPDLLIIKQEEVAAWLQKEGIQSEAQEAAAHEQP